MDCSPPGSSVHGDSPDKNIGVDCHALLQGTFPTWGRNPGFPHCRWILYHLSHQGSPRMLEWVAYPFSRGSSRPRNSGSPALQADSFPSWTTREAPEQRKILANCSFEDDNNDGEDEAEDGSGCDMSPFLESFPWYQRRCILSTLMVPWASPSHDTYMALSLLLTHLSPSADNKFFVGSNCILFTTIALVPSLEFDTHWALRYPSQNLPPEALSLPLPWIVIGIM